MSLTAELILPLLLAGAAAVCLALFLSFHLQTAAAAPDAHPSPSPAQPDKRGKQSLLAIAIALLGALLAHPGGIFAMLAAAIVSGILGWFLPLLLAHFSLGKQRTLREKQIPAALDLLANGMRAGMSFLQAWTFATRQTPDPFGSEMNVTLNEIQLGRPLEEALERLRQRVQCEDMDLTVSAIRLTLQTGGDLPKGLATIAATIRSRAVMRAKIDALTAQGRLQALLVAAIPVVMVFVTYAVDPVRTSLLWTTAYGWILMSVIALMDVLGFLTIQWICKIKI
jgi:tight adherence protein B